MSKVAVVYHSGYGHTEVIAHEVAAGVGAAGGEAILLKIESAAQDFSPFLEQIEGADAVVFGAPTYMGSASAPMKAFMDASSKPWFSLAWKDKLAAGFTNSGALSGDKLNTLVQFVVLAAQHGMVWVGPATLPGNLAGNTDAAPETQNRLGSSVGVMTQSDNASPEITPPAGDKASARALGERVVQAATRWGHA